MKVLIVGTTGMLGYSLFCNLSSYSDYEVYGTVRNTNNKESFFTEFSKNIFENINVTNIASLEKVIFDLKPDVVINCIGLIKQRSISKQHLDSISINSLLPHQIASVCERNNAKLIHFSTDCVFDGNAGLYKESDLPTALDLYGKSKCLGEVDYTPHLTLRTSIIGHELSSQVSLVDWFLAQNSPVKGFAKAIFSGLPTCHVAKVLAEFILPNRELSGLYHLSVKPINKYDLLKLVQGIYQKEIIIEKDVNFKIDRSLDSSKLQNEIEYAPPEWPELIQEMHVDYLKYYKSKV